jgi:DNA adenine methylase
VRQPSKLRAPGRPLLKWAGGKRQILATLRRYYPAGFDRYVEPFVGSGAVFFDLHAAGRLRGGRAHLADVNADLIGCYRTVRDDADAVIAILAALEEEHRARGAVCYYDVRDRRFNPARVALGDRTERGYTAELAAMLIYLNRTGYNGLFRLNRRGLFNVPVGRYANPRICDSDHIRTVAMALSADHVSLECEAFDQTLARAAAGDFVYCDPPYAPVSRTANFAHYTADGFTAADQQRLQAAVVDAARRGATVLVSNSSAPEIEASYRAPAARRAGLRVRRVPARRAINSLAGRRGPIDELVITNAVIQAVPLRMARGHLRSGDSGQLSAARTRKRQA